MLFSSWCLLKHNKILILIKSNLSVFSYTDHAFGVICEESCLDQGYRYFPLCFLVTVLLLAPMFRSPLA